MIVRKQTGLIIVAILTTSLLLGAFFFVFAVHQEKAKSAPLLISTRFEIDGSAVIIDEYNRVERINIKGGVGYTQYNYTRGGEVWVFFKSRDNIYVSPLSRYSIKKGIVLGGKYYFVVNLQTVHRLPTSSDAKLFIYYLGKIVCGSDIPSMTIRVSSNDTFDVVLSLSKGEIIPPYRDHIDGDIDQFAVIVKVNSTNITFDGATRVFNDTNSTYFVFPIYTEKLRLYFSIIDTNSTYQMEFYIANNVNVYKLTQAIEDDIHGDTTLFLKTEPLIITV